LAVLERVENLRREIDEQLKLKEALLDKKAEIDREILRFM
jgi:hypothetical protein